MDSVSVCAQLRFSLVELPPLELKQFAVIFNYRDAAVLSDSAQRLLHSANVFITIANATGTISD